MSDEPTQHPAYAAEARRRRGPCPTCDDLAVVPLPEGRRWRPCPDCVPRRLVLVEAPATNNDGTHHGQCWCETCVAIIEAKAGR